MSDNGYRGCTERPKTNNGEGEHAKNNAVTLLAQAKGLFQVCLKERNKM